MCTQPGALDGGGGGSLCHVSILRISNVALSNLRNDHVAMSNLKKLPCPMSLSFKTPCRMSLSPEEAHVAVSILGV